MITSVGNHFCTHSRPPIARFATKLALDGGVSSICANQGLFLLFCIKLKTLIGSFFIIAHNKVSHPKRA